MRKLPIALIAGAGLVATAAVAQDVTSWIEAPTAAQMAAAYPARARAAGISGGVQLSCTVQAAGRMGDCVVVGENPKGYGFGSVARKLAETLRASGVNKGEEVMVPVSFPADVLKPGGMVAKTPKWAALPTLADMQAVVPKTPGGPNDIRVTLVCEVQAGGTLTACAVDREMPEGQGFGQAVLSLAPKFRVEPWSAEGMPTVGAKVRVPVRFDLKPVAQAAR